jgi:hypothetical protein
VGAWFSAPGYSGGAGWVAVTGRLDIAIEGVRKPTPAMTLGRIRRADRVWPHGHDYPSQQRSTGKLVVLPPSHYTFEISQY